MAEQMTMVLRELDWGNVLFFLAKFFSPPPVMPCTAKLTRLTSNDRRLTRTSVPVRAKLGIITIRHRGRELPFSSASLLLSRRSFVPKAF